MKTGPTPRQARAATDIANSGIPVKVGMALTAHKTVTMFMRYVHTEDDSVRAAVEAVASRRQGLIVGTMEATASKLVPDPIIKSEPVEQSIAERDKPLGFEDSNYRSRTKLGNYRPFRHRRTPNRAVPAGSQRNIRRRTRLVMTDKNVSPLQMYRDEAAGFRRQLS